MNKFEKQLTKTNFRKWLESYSPKSKVAPAEYDFFTCPLANFVKTFDNDIIKVYVTGYDIGILKILSINESQYKKYVILAPKWAKKFVSHVDSISHRKCSVSAKQALFILNKLS